MQLEDVIIILSRPAEAGNVGAVCRAMKNMGLSRLRVVRPGFLLDSGVVAKETEGALPGVIPGSSGNSALIRARAVHAVDVWEGAEFFDTLDKAIQDCSLVIGTTRRRGRGRKQVTMSPSEIAAVLKDRPGNAALVFGNERTGLEDAELELCGLASHIPTGTVFPSLNLSHAVMIYSYELFLRLAKPLEEAVKGQWVPLEQKRIETLVRELTDKLKVLGFYKKPGREEQERFLRDLLSRAAATEREARYFSDLFVRADNLSRKGEISDP